MVNYTDDGGFPEPRNGEPPRASPEEHAARRVTGSLPTWRVSPWLAKSAPSEDVGSDALCSSPGTDGDAHMSDEV